MDETTRTCRQLAVMRAMKNAQPPYVDQVQRMSGLAADEFAAAVRDLKDTGVVVSFSAPLGTLLYPTLRSSEQMS